MPEEDTAQNKSEPQPSVTNQQIAALLDAHKFSSNFYKWMSLFFLPIGVVMLANVVFQYFRHGENGNPLQLHTIIIGLVISSAFIIFGIINAPRRTTRILKMPQAIITYEEKNLLKHFDSDSVEVKLREILTALPGADLTPYKQSLNISVLNIQRIPPKPEPPPPPDPEKDIFR